jgi:hypothetical protein
MTNHRRVVRQPNILRIMIPPIVMRMLIRITPIRRPRILIYYKCPLDINLHRSRMRDRAVYFSSVRAHACESQ